MNITPAHTKGKKTDLEYSLSMPDSEGATKCFYRACRRLQNPPVWHELTGVLSPVFTLVTDDDHLAHRLAHVGDKFRIEMPGPGNALGGGYDWVAVEAIEDQLDQEAYTEAFGMRLRACNNAKDAKSHFFTTDATSSFEIVRTGNTITARYHGRNEVPNTHTGRAVNNIRNAVVATIGLIGVSEAQWYALIKSLLQDEIGG